MKLIRTMLLTAGLVMFAQAAAAQSLSSVSLQALTAAREQQGTATWTLTWQAQTPELNLPLRNSTFEFSTPMFGDCGASSCPVLGQCSWFNQMLQQSMTTWQRLCGRTEQACPAAVGRGAVIGAVVGVPACCAKPGSAVEALKCSCVKECACCESCAKSKAVSDAKPVVQAYPTPWPSAQPLPPSWIPMPRPVQMTMPGHTASTPRIVALPQAPPAAYQIVRSTPVSVPQPQQAHLVTADFDIRCDRMTHKGDLIMLEGNVRLVRLTQGRHMLVEAPRVMFNVRDGSFTVETDGRPQSAPVGVMRTSAVEPMHPGVTVIAVPAQPHAYVPEFGSIRISR